MHFVFIISSFRRCRKMKITVSALLRQRERYAVPLTFLIQNWEKNISCLLFYSSNITTIRNYSTDRSYWVLSQSFQE
jgi:hypothetical protein